MEREAHADASTQGLPVLDEMSRELFPGLQMADMPGQPAVGLQRSNQDGVAGLERRARLRDHGVAPLEAERRYDCCLLGPADFWTTTPTAMSFGWSNGVMTVMG